MYNNNPLLGYPAADPLSPSLPRPASMLTEKERALELKKFCISTALQVNADSSNLLSLAREIEEYIKSGT
jgi:hypothetical protein